MSVSDQIDMSALQFHHRVHCFQRSSLCSYYLLMQPCLESFLYHRLKCEAAMEANYIRESGDLVTKDVRPFDICNKAYIFGGWLTVKSHIAKIVSANDAITFYLRLAVTKETQLKKVC